MKVNGLMKVTALLAMLAGGLLNQVDAASLKIGDPAPKLQVGKWVQGEPVDSLKSDKAYIVEFWATWCGPCRVSIPHLNEIHTKFKDKGLVVIGQNCWERDESQVEPFIKRMGDKMTYRVALDDKSESKNGKMAETWMEAAGQNGIPAAFLVDKQGRIAWIGHPMKLTEDTITAVLEGKYDMKKAAAEAELQAKNEQKLAQLSGELDGAMRGKDWDKATSTVEEIGKLLPEGQRTGLDFVRVQILLAKGDMEGAGKMALRVSNANKQNAMVQNQLAWGMLISEGISGAALDAAAEVAEQANQTAGGKDPGILDTLARANFMRGQKDKAVECQSKAVELADGDMKASLQKTLDSYKEGKLPSAR
jgi:thiol-disulfide isomerase/thioredoxin